MIKKTKPKKSKKKMLMTAKEYRDALDALGLTPASQRTARAIGVKNVRRSQRFARGETEIPDSVARLLKCYIEHGLPDDVRNDA